jgi:hypothetical protein
MLYRLLADLVVVIHLAFLGFVGAGSLLAWWRPRLAWLHPPCLIWAVTSITVGLPCPLTSLEKLLRRSAGEAPYQGGFVDHYVEGVILPESLTPLVWAMAMAAIVVGYARLSRTPPDHWRRSRKAVAAARPFS